MKKMLSVFLLIAMLAASLSACAPEQGLFFPDPFNPKGKEQELSYASQNPWNGQSDTTWYTEHSSASVYYLSDGADLRGLVELVASKGVTFAGKTVKLKNSINLGGRIWKAPVSDTNAFEGTLDGDGYTIGDFKMNANSNGQSLLGRIAGSATVRNLTVTNAVITMNASDDCTPVGGLFAVATTRASKTITLENLILDVMLTTPASGKSFDAVGGVVGLVEGDGAILIKGCVSKGSIRSEGEQVGGMVGCVTGSVQATLEGCVNYGSVTARAKIAGMVGAFMAYSGNASYTNCLNYGNLTILPTSDSGQVGGMVGRYEASAGDLRISACGNEGTLLYQGNAGGGSWMGGIGGYLVGTNGTINVIEVTSCYNKGKITANRTSGGLLGFVQVCTTLTVANCNVNADLSFLFQSAKNPYSGGLIGMIDLANKNTRLATIKNCTVDGTIAITDKGNGLSYTGGLIGALRSTTVNASECEIRSLFSKVECEEDDVINMLLGYNQNAASKINPDRLTYVWRNEIAKIEEYLEPSGDSISFKSLGVQMRENAGADGILGTGDDTVDLRYVFGVRNAKEAFLGFAVNVRVLDDTVTYTQETRYLRYVYTALMADGKKLLAAQYNVDYFMTLTLTDIPANDIEPGVYGTPYVKNSVIDILPFSSSTQDAQPIPGVGIYGYGLKPEEHRFEMRNFSPVLPEAFANAKGIIAAQNLSYANGQGISCQTAQRIHATNDQYSLKYTCTCGGACAWSANAVTSHRLGENVPYHYYVDTDSFEAQYGQKIDRYEAYHSWSFEVAEDGYYEFCFRIRLGGTDGAVQTRYALLQIDDASYSEQTELYYTITVRDTTLRNNSTDHDSYLLGYGANLKAGKHTLTFRLPYDESGVNKSSSFHIRDVYLIKGAAFVNESPVPLPAGTMVYDGNFNESTCTYALNNATYSTYTDYIKVLTDAGFVLRESRTNEYEYLSFDGANYKDGADNDRFNEFHLFTNDEYMVHAYFLEGPKKIRIVVSDIEEYHKYAANSAQNAKRYETVTTPMFASLDIADHVAQGMCFVYRLSDGRFILIDGGQWSEDRTTKDATLLYEYLKSKSPNGKVVIATWIITHLHSDHMNIAWLFEQMYGREVEIQSYMYNFPSYEYARSMPSSNLKVDYYTKRYPMMHELMDRYTTLVEHTGFVYQFADCTIEVLYTHEDYYPEYINSFNNSNNVLKITLGGKSFLIAGDLEEPGQKACNKQAGTLLDADFLQITHHGYNGQIEFYKYIVNNELEDTVVLWTLPNQNPSPKYSLAANKWLKENVKQIHFPYEDREYDLSK